MYPFCTWRTACDSVHWLLAAVNTATRTFTFYNSYGRHGQRKWSPALKTWLTQHIHGPWTATQGTAIQQPGTTECGTHTLLNIINHIQGAPTPDTSTIRWSHNMRIHIINTIIASGYTPDINHTYEDSADVVLIPPRKKQHCAHNGQPQPGNHNTTDTDSIPSTPAEPRKQEPSVPPPSQLTHTTAHTTPQEAHIGGAEHRRLGKRKVSARALTNTGHIIARDCLSSTSTLHWEGARNDQCEACDEGGTLTECTRCNLVWHASCLHPTPISPLRRQDAIVCSEQCWDELTTAAHGAGMQTPTRETHTTKRRFMPHKHNNNNTTHPFPLITYAGSHPPPPGPSGTATTHIEQPVVQPEQPLEDKEATTGNKRKLPDKTATSNRPTTRQRTTPITKKRKRTAGTTDTRNKKRKPTLSAHINPWTISSGILRKQSLQATRAATAASKIPP